MIEIRRANLSDLETLRQLGYELLKFEHENYDPTLDLSWPSSEAGKETYRRAIQEKYTIIAYDNNEPIGYLIGTIQPSTDGARSTANAYLNNIYVCESARHNHVGHVLIASLHQYCISQKIENINVTVISANKSAISFYEREGFLPSRLILSKKLTDS